MEKLNFYTVDLEYVNFLKDAEQNERGYSRVPNMSYGDTRKPKFLCGIVLRVNNADYYVPVTSYTKQKEDNFLIRAGNGKVTSSLRFNYMFPVPKVLVTERTIVKEPDRAYRALLAQELRFCIKNQETIQHLAERTYKRVLLGKNHGLVVNSCAFLLLEGKCREYIAALEKGMRQKASMTKAEKGPSRQSFQELAAAAKAEAAKRNDARASGTQQHKLPEKQER